MQAIPIALMAGGSLVKGVGGFKRGKAERKIGYANAWQAENEGAGEEARLRDRARIALGRQVGAQAESGFEMGTGTAIDSLKESATEFEIEAMDVRRQARSRAIAYRQQGKAAYKQGKGELIGGFFGAAQAVAGGVNDYAQVRRG